MYDLTQYNSRILNQCLNKQEFLSFKYENYHKNIYLVVCNNHISFMNTMYCLH